MAKIELLDVCKIFPLKKSKTISKFVRIAGTGGNGKKKEKPFSIDHLSLEIPDAKIFVILGPSGCGKTTLLKIIAGLFPIDSGSIRFNGIDVNDVNPGERKIGMVFQDYALYPHYTSRLNIISYFLFKRKTKEMYEQAQEKFDRTSELMGVDIEYLLDKKPGSLSSGEQQRVAIGRCITRDPNVFLMDEPFSNLDRLLREKYRVNVKKLLTQFNVTTVYVTHDQHEAAIFADSIAIMNDGKIEQIGTYEDLYNNPDTIFVAGFLNIAAEAPAINIIDGKSISGSLPVNGTRPEDIKIGVRPEDIGISQEQKDNHIKSTVKKVEDNTLTKISHITTNIGDIAVGIRAPIRKDISAGNTVWLAFKKYHAFDKKTGKRIRSYP